MQNNWDTYKFHCSGLPTLMTHGKGKDELLGESAKSYLLEIWIEETFGRKKYDMVGMPTLKKGIMVESDSLEIVSKSLEVPLFKNKTFFENDFICGTPDVVKPYLIDIKSSWDIWTFFNRTEKKAKSDYFWQMAGYMVLTNQEKAQLIYVLVTTPAEITEGELYKASYRLTDEQIELARKNYEYDDIDSKLRIKQYEFELQPELVDEVILQCTAARNYLKSLDIANL